MSNSSVRLDLSRLSQSVLPGDGLERGLSLSNSGVLSDIISPFISFEDSLSIRDELASICAGCDGVETELNVSLCGERTGAGNSMLQLERSTRMFTLDDIWSRHLHQF